MDGNKYNYNFNLFLKEHVIHFIILMCFLCFSFNFKSFINNETIKIKSEQIERQKEQLREYRTKYGNL